MADINPTLSVILNAIGIQTTIARQIFTKWVNGSKMGKLIEIYTFSKRYILDSKIQIG